MALNLNDLNKLVRENEKVLIDEQEKKIDDELSKRWSGGNSITISVNTSGNNINSAVVRRELEKRYVKAGWKLLKFKNDQRDGEMVTLTVDDQKDFCGDHRC